MHLVYLVSETLKVSHSTKRMLLRVAARLQEKLGRRVDFDEAIKHLLSSEIRRTEFLDEVVGSIPNVTVEELFEERRRDERRTVRRYRL